MPKLKEFTCSHCHQVVTAYLDNDQKYHCSKCDKQISQN